MSNETIKLLFFFFIGIVAGGSLGLVLAVDYIRRIARRLNHIENKISKLEEET